MSTTDPRHYDVILSPVITEKATIASEQNQVMFKVATHRDQAADQGSGREAVRRQGQERQHPCPQGQGQGLQGQRRHAVAGQARDRDPRRGSPHRRDHGSVRSSAMALKTYNPVTPSQRQLVHRRPLRPASRRAGQGADRGQALVRRPQQQRPHHGAVPRRRPQAGLSHGRLQAPQVRRAGEGRAHRIRSEPHRLHRADQVRGRRARLHPGAAAALAGRHAWSPASTST